MQYDLDLKSENKALFLSARKLLMSFEGIAELKKERITTYSNDKSGICHMRTMPHGIDIGFLKGVQMEDKYKRLTGTGKVMRILPLSSFDKTIVTYYVKQAIQINALK
jgi:hypothetical protein